MITNRHPPLHGTTMSEGDLFFMMISGESCLMQIPERRQGRLRINKEILLKVKQQLHSTD